MTAEAAVAAIGVHDHGHGVPADVALDAHFHFPIAGERGLVLGRNRVDVGRADDARGFDAGFAQAFGEAAEELRGAFRAAFFQRDFEQRFQRLQDLVAIAVVSRVSTRASRRPRARLRLLFVFFLRFHFKFNNNAVIIRRGKFQSARVKQHEPRTPDKCSTNIRRMS